MANISVSEDDFTALADAANDAQASGNHRQASRLDTLARKANAALSSARTRRRCASSGAPPAPPLSWRDVDSVIRE